MTTTLSSSGLSTDTGRGRMLMLLSLMMEDCSEGESELSSQSCGGRNFSASPPLTLYDQSEGGQQHQIVTPTASRCMLRWSESPRHQHSLNGHGHHKAATGNGQTSLQMASSRSLERKHLSPDSCPLAENRNHTVSQLHSLWRGDSHVELSSLTERILKVDPMAVRRRYKLPRLTVNPNSFYRHEREVYEPYDLPLNLAILHHGDSKVFRDNREALKLLAQASSDVLTLADGPDQGGSLGIALRHHPENLELTKLLLETNPSCAMVTDQRRNLPLHVACFYGASLPVVREVFFANPRALFNEPNWNGETPYHIALRNHSLSSSSVSDFFYTVTARQERGKRQTQALSSTTR